MKVELRQLRYFVALAEELHFGRAAGRVFLSQPALSQQLAKLEQELGVRLLERGARKVELTEAGRALLEDVRWLGGGSASLRVGYPEYINATPFPAALLAFAERHPEVRMEELELSAAVVADALRNGRIDVGFTHSAVALRNLAFVPLMPLGLVAVLAPTHPLANCSDLPFRALAGETLILPPPEVASGFRAHVVGCCRKAGFEPEVVSGREPGILSTETLARLVRTGAGVAVNFDLYGDARWPGVVRRPLREPNAPLDFGVAHRGEDVSRLIRAFVEAAQEQAGERSRQFT